MIKAGSRAPSAHNTQPWRLTPLGSRSYSLWYCLADKLRADPDDRDGMMAMGGFYETLRLSAHAHECDVELTPVIEELADGVSLGSIEFKDRHGPPDPLALSIGERQCNRHEYARRPLPAGLVEALTSLGQLLVSPISVAPLVSKASVLAWKDSRFVRDLDEWTRFDDTSADGMTTDCLQLSKVDQAALKFALRRGRLPGWLARVYATRDVRLTRASSSLVVLTTASRDPLSLFEAGRRLIQSWTLINSVGYSWHPMSIVIDQSTVHQLQDMIDGADPVAIYRVGLTDQDAAWSKRRDIADIVVQR
ncbi:MAG: hypothetical protein JF887_06550 [Candidatus Dormibacteraeota bacterium]|uniref:Nitroreductase domain-containing protein n=1 Tax=Candidatus Amunia macphersoniae TaxID=3127014 RepID=A0A934KHW0_9BACT|nr:hypothetical protein [Candidatus Dormibacteraeota bacterium]